MDRFEEFSARVDDLVARGFDWSHAWEIVGRQNPPRIAAPAASAGAARNGYHPSIAGFPPIPRCVCGGYLIHSGLGKMRECGWCHRTAFD